MDVSTSLHQDVNTSWCPDVSDDSFAGSERYERFAVAVGELEGIAETLGDIDVSWG